MFAKKRSSTGREEDTRRADTEASGVATGEVIDEPRGRRRDSRVSFLALFATFACSALLTILVLEASSGSSSGQNTAAASGEEAGNNTGGVVATATQRSWFNFNPAVTAPVVKDTRPVVAYATTLTKVEKEAGGFLDAVEVLGLSIDLICRDSSYACAKVVILHDGAGAEAEALLKGMGWRVVLRPVPVEVAKIANEFYREALPKSGCCGELELLKLWAYRLTEYHRVVHVDADVLFLKPLDSLIDLDASLVYTPDHSMGMASEGAPPVQGGFLLVKPSEAVFDELVATVYEGDWRPGSGWGGTNIGWCWGGPTIQGLLPYYYLVLRKDLPSVAVDNCIYNHMFDSVKCRETPGYAFEAMHSVHFTACQKPWYCLASDSDLQCKKATERWNVFWLELARQRNATGQLLADHPCRSSGEGSYTPLPRAALT